MLATTVVAAAATTPASRPGRHSDGADVDSLVSMVVLVVVVGFMVTAISGSFRFRAGTSDPHPLHERPLQRSTVIAKKFEKSSPTLLRTGGEYLATASSSSRPRARRAGPQHRVRKTSG